MTACPSCNKEVREGDYFCFACGARLHGESNVEWSAKPMVGQDIPWEMIENEMCRVKSFKPFYTVEDGNLKASDNVPRDFPICALLEVESIMMRDGAIMPVLHSEDFKNLVSVFNGRGVKDEEDVVVAYTRFYKNRPLEIFKAIGPWWAKYINPKASPRLHVYVYRRNENGLENLGAGQPVLVLRPKGWDS